MASISSKETKPEVLLRKQLFAKGYRFRKNVRTLPGKPDIVLKKYSTVIFVNGCFWHGHIRCKAAKLPKTNTAFWKTKIQSNVDRDKRNAKELRSLGWKVIQVWQCDTASRKKLDMVISRVMKQLT